LLTQAALAQTQAAEAILTVTATPTTTALPDTGFADDVGVPALLGMAGLLILVIFVARRLREATA
jgi:LPXTG-motif cell wall-anchored protein